MKFSMKKSANLKFKRNMNIVLAINYMKHIKNQE